MLNVLLARLYQGHRTARYPDEAASLPDRLRGGPSLDPSRCPAGRNACSDACPTDAIHTGPGSLELDMGRCLFCTECVDACPENAIALTSEYRLAARRRDDLIVRGRAEPRQKALDAKLRRLFGRSLKLRQVSAGGCNACEADVNVLGTVVFDLARFGIQFVASPRHADGLLITGPVTENMKLALKKTYDAVPEPRIVIAVGACAISGGPYAGHPEVHGGAESVVPVDLYVPGCPPHPYTILDGLLGLLDRLDNGFWVRAKQTGTRIAQERQRVEQEHKQRRALDAARLLGVDLEASPDGTTETEDGHDSAPPRETERTSDARVISSLR
jgi:Ni,Fe-hydrogenase III small subunit/NAD-dependent dihydropyrimidine dehydrogenase PreA subunit